MANVLSQQQIDELLGNLQSGELDLEEVEKEQSSKKIKEYDFRSPRKVTKDQTKYLTNIFDHFARFFSMRLTGLLRQTCQIDVVNIEEEEYKEFNNALADSILVGMFGLDCEKAKIDEEQILVEMSKPLSFMMMELLLGGTGKKSKKINRDYTDIELSIMHYIFKAMIPHLDNAWSNYIDVTHTFDNIETNSRILQFVSPDVTIAIVVFEVTINKQKEFFNICIPTPLFEKLLPFLDTRVGVKKGDSKHLSVREDLFGFVKSSSLDVTGLLGSTDIAIEELLKIQKGDVIVLDNRTKDDNIQILVENTPWFEGSVGINKKNFSVKVESIVKGLGG